MQVRPSPPQIFFLATALDTNEIEFNFPHAAYPGSVDLRQHNYSE